MRIVSVGHALLALTLIAFGIQGFITADFAQLWRPAFRNVPAREALVYLCSVVSLGCGIGLVVRRTAAAASRVLLGFFVAWLALMRLPILFVAFAVNTWWACAQTSAMTGAAWVLYVWLGGDHDARRVGFAAGSGSVRIAQSLYGIGLIPFGIAHFLYMQNTAPLVPAWLPWHTAFGYFTGAAFIAAGLAAISGVLARIAVALSALQIGLFTVLIWVPVVLKTTKPSDWGEFAVSCALTAAGWVVAESYRVGVRSTRGAE